MTSFTGFQTIRADRDVESSGKQKGGGLILLINGKWCNPSHVTIKEQICTKDTELLAVSLRTHYLPREFTVVNDIVVYIRMLLFSRSTQTHLFSFLVIITMSLSPRICPYLSSLLTLQQGEIKL